MLIDEKAKNQLRLLTIIVGMLASFGMTNEKVLGEMISVSLDGNARDWVVEESTGRVFVSRVGSTEITEYSSAGRKIQTFNCISEATELIIKQNWLVCACPESSDVVLINLTTNKVEGQVNVTNKRLRCLFSSKVENGLVYCITEPSDSQHRDELLQIDLKSRKVRNLINPFFSEVSSITSAALSEDGKLVVFGDQGYSSEPKSVLCSFDEDKLIAKQMWFGSSTKSAVHAGPANRFWYSGANMLSADMMHHLQPSGGEAISLHPTYDLLAIASSRYVSFRRLYGEEDISGLTISKAETENPRLTDENLFSPTVRFDLVNHRVFVGLQSKGVWVDLPPASTLKPLKLIKAPIHVNAFVGSKIEIPVEAYQGGPEDKLTITKGPTGMRLEKGVLTWETNNENIGLHEINLELRDKQGANAIDRFKLQVEVATPRLLLGFNGYALRVSPSGKHVICWGERGAARSSIGDADSNQGEIVVFDTEAMQEVGRRTIPQGIRLASIDDRNVYLIAHGGNVLQKLNYKLEGSERIFLKFQPGSLRLFPSNKLVLYPTKNYIDTKTFKLVEPSKNGMSELEAFDSHPQNRSLYHGSKHFQDRGKIYDLETEEVVRYIEAPGLPDFFTPNDNNPALTAHLQSQAYTYDVKEQFWGRFVRDRSVHLLNGSLIGELVKHTGSPDISVIQMSPDYPVVFVIKLQREPAGTYLHNLHVMSVFDASELYTAKIFEGGGYSDFSFQYLGGGDETARNFACKKNKYFYCSGTSLIVGEIPEKVLSSAQKPNHFAPLQITEITGDKLISEKLNVNGDTNGVSFGLENSISGLELNPDTGEIAIDGDEIWAKAVEVYASSRKTNDFTRPSFNDRYNLSTNANAYETLTGKKLGTGKLAITLPIIAKMANKDGQEEVCSFKIIVVGPMKPFEKVDEDLKLANKKKQDEMEKRDIAARREAQERDEKMRRETRPSGNKSDRERIADLEQRIQRLEAALEAALGRQLREGEPVK